MDEVPIWRVRIKGKVLELAYIVEAHSIEAATEKTKAYIKKRPFLKGFVPINISHEPSRDIGIDIE